MRLAFAQRRWTSELNLCILLYSATGEIYAANGILRYARGFEDEEESAEMNLLDFIIKDSYILVPVLYVIGVFLKRTPKIPDWLIPWILLGLGMIGAFFLSGMKLSGVLQGVLVAGVTVFANQLYKQTIYRGGGGL